MTLFLLPTHGWEGHLLLPHWHLVLKLLEVNLVIVFYLESRGVKSHLFD